MFRRVQKDIVLLNAVTATAVCTALNVSDFRTITVAVAASNSPNLKLFFQGAVGATAPNFATTRSATNIWDYIEVIDLQDGTAIDGDTGITLTSGGYIGIRLFEVNTNGIDWLSVNATAFVAGIVTAKASVYTNL